MFTPAMTDEELQNAALRDFLEIRMKVKIAFEQYIRNFKPDTGGGVRLIHSLVESKTIRTKSKNTWNVSFRFMGRGSEAGLQGACLLYTPWHKGDQVFYLFMNNLDSYQLEMLTPHFLQRYKERFLDYNHINLRGMHPAIYYMLNNWDRRITVFCPKKWTEEDLKEKNFLISGQGLSPVKVYKKLTTYITFLDEENLSYYKAMAYEENTLWHELSMLTKLDFKSPEDILQIRAIHKKMMANPDAKNILRRHMLKVIQLGKDSEYDIDELVDKVWDELTYNCESIEKNWEKAIHELSPKSFLDSQLEKTSQSVRVQRWDDEIG